MWLLEKEFKFEASHQLPNHEGKCKRLHGHSWKGRVLVAGYHLHTTGPEAGMVTDYDKLSKPIKLLVDKCLDHYHLNDSLQLENPTSEAIAKWIYYQLRECIPQLIGVAIEETCTSRCVYLASTTQLATVLAES